MIYGDAVYGETVYGNATYGGEFAPPSDPATVTVIIDDLRNRVRYLGPTAAVLVIPTVSAVEVLAPKRSWIKGT
jgi:hypothetical protein